MPGCQVLVAGGALTEPMTSDTIRSAKQSVVVWARAGVTAGASRRRASPAGAKRCMATPLEAERPRDGSPGATKTPASSGPGCHRQVVPRALSRERSVTTSSRAGFLARGCLLAGPSQERLAPSGIFRFSLPPTVAGQRGHHTPFPFQPLRPSAGEIAHDAKCQRTRAGPIYAG